MLARIFPQISETSLLSDEIGLLVEDTGMDVIDVKPSPLGECHSYKR